MYQELKQLLRKPYYLKRKLIELVEKLHELRTAGSLIISHPQRIGSRGSRHYKMNDAERLINIEEKIQSVFVEYLEAYIKTYSLISTITDMDIRIIFVERYLAGKNWTEISCDLELSISQTYTLHSKGLALLDSMARDRNLLQ